MKTSVFTFEEYKEERDKLTIFCSDIGKELSAYPKNEMGMTIEEIRNTQAYQEKRKLYNSMFQKLRNLNSFYVKFYSKELAKERKAKINALTEAKNEN